VVELHGKSATVAWCFATDLDTNTHPSFQAWWSSLMNFKVPKFW
jgi:hypothetical protein